MITRIEVDGFKSLRSFALDLEPLTAIVGANGAGKSNLFDALHLLSLLAQTKVTEALKGDKRGTIRDQFSRMQDGAAAERIRLGAELLLPTESGAWTAEVQTRVRYEIEIGRTLGPSGLDDITIVDERIVMLSRAADGWMARHPELAPLARYEWEGAVVDASGTVDAPGMTPGVRGAPARGSIRAQRKDWKQSAGMMASPHRSILATWGVAPIVSELAAELSAVRVIHVEPSKLRLASQPVDPALAPDGSNLPTALAALDPGVRAQIRADLAELIPGFRTFEIVTVDEEMRLEVEFTDGARIHARALSDGTLRLIALLTLMRSARPGVPLAVEEPENGIYPGRQRALVDKLVDATTSQDGALPPQVLLTSHSPAILAALQGRPGSLVFADLVRRGTDLRTTRMRRVRADGRVERDPDTVSRREIERILDAARPEDEA
jgi:predicted ATPase